MLRVAFAILFAGAISLMAQTIDRTKPPKTPPIPSYKLPSLHEAKLPNGLAVVMVEDKRFPLVTARLSFLAGARRDPKDLPGLAENVAALLPEGTKTRTSRQIAEDVASIGGTLNGVAGADGLTLAGSALSEYLPKLLTLMSDVALNATFPENELALRKQNRKQELLAQLSDPAFLAERELNEVVFGSSPYAHIAPTMAALDRLDRKSVTGFRDKYLVPNNAVLILIGRLPETSETLKIARQEFGSWKRKDLPPPPKMEFPPSRREIVLVNRPGSVQADIHVGRLAVTRSNPDYYPLVMGSVVLGGGASSRMFREIREKQGFAYDAHALLDPKRDTGIMTAVTQVRNEVVGPALKSVLHELDAMGEAPVSPAELTNAKNFVSGLFLLRLETQRGLADQLNMMRLMGLPDDYLEKYTERIRAVRADEVQRVAKKYIVPENATIVVVGDAGKIQKPLEEFGKVTVTKVQE